MQKLVLGMKVVYLPQPEWGVGHLIALDEAGGKAQVLFPAREGGPVIVSTKGGALVGRALKPGEEIMNRQGQEAVISEEVEGGRGLRRYVFHYRDGTEDEMPESEIFAAPPKPDLLSLLKRGQVGDARGFLLRRAALKLDDERRCDALGALFASRVMVKPHQVGVVQRVLSSRRPRFVLADEVGLGKTIETGMIFSALRLSGLANRVLIVAPSHLTVQWLVELFHKFNQLFTLMDSDRFEQSLTEMPDVSPWARFPRIITSLEMLQRSAEHRALTADPGAYWDLAVFDEAHHLKSEKAYLAAEGIAKNSWGLLLLTATPMQLDPTEYHQLLQLIDPSTAPTLSGFEARLARQEELSSAVRSLLDKSESVAALKRLSDRFPEDAVLKTQKPGSSLLAHLAETYSLSDRLIRNRRAVVGGFSNRKLHRHSVVPSAAEEAARAQALQTLSQAKGVSGAVLANLLRRLESSPAAFHQSVANSSALSGAKDTLRVPEKDSKFVVFQKVLKDIWAAEKDAKVLVFTEARETLESIQKELSKEGVEALGYHGDLALVERDRQVARFRDPDGPQILLCTEVGGEGRNFQFSHHLVNYDLPWSPAAMEQRIGRLDRIGQMHPVQVHVFDTKGSLSADVLSILADAVGVFEETVGGLDAVLEEVESRLTELALHPPEERARYMESLKAKVAAAKESVKRAYDPLLDLRSFDKDAVQSLVVRAHARMGLEEEEDDLDLEEGLHAISRDLDERLEETVTELARRVGIGVDTDEQVDAFHTAFHLGHALKVDALPGINIEEEKTLMGSFWRDTAVEREEIEYFATGHSLVESLFGFMRDGPYGRNGFRLIEKRGALKAKGIEFLFHVVPPEAEDTSAGAKVPSRQLARFVDKWLIHSVVVAGPDGKPKADTSLDAVLESEGRSLRGDEVRAAFPGLEEFVDDAVELGTTAAEAQMRVLMTNAKAAIDAEEAGALARMRLSLEHQGIEKAAMESQLSEERVHYQSMRKALAGLRVGLDSACGFVINR